MTRDEIRELANFASECSASIYVGGVSVGTLNAIIQRYESIASDPYAYGDDGGVYQDGVESGLAYALEILGYDVYAGRTIEH